MNNPISRRQILKTASAGFGYLAFAGLSTSASAGALQDKSDEKSSNPLAPKKPHLPAKAKRVIFLCMRGGPSHVDTFDYKPQLYKDDGKPSRFRGNYLKPQWDFKQRGESGLWISELLPEISKHADDLCLIRSMNCDQPVHPRALTQMHTGNAQFVRPSLGAWTLYGLGTENDSMPGFISLNPPAGSAQNHGSAFLPAVYQGTVVGGAQRRPAGAMQRRRGQSSAPLIPDIKNAKLDRDQQRRQLELIQDLNKDKLERESGDPQVEGVIESYELAFRMQDEMPKLMDVSKESRETLDMYGIGQGNDSFAKQCLLARRFVESGVRFVEVTHGSWDHHANLSTVLPQRCNEIDGPIAALLNDLKQRDMLKDTLVIWGGEFGRTPFAQGGNGRDHNNKGYTTWMAGGGVKGGLSYGATDEYGYEAVDETCHIHDWHATILHLLGLDHEQLTYRYAGRDFRLTDVAGNVAKRIIA